MISQFAGPTWIETVSGDPDGLHVEEVTIKGLPELIKTPHGGVLIRDLATLRSGQTATESSQGRRQRMSTPPSLPGAARTDGSSVQIGALVPLTRPGWVEAGQHLLAGLELAVREVNDAGGIVGRPLELVVRDTAADPQRAAAAVDELARLGVAALAGEYHSVVARAAAARADALGLPFLCSSAVLDALTEQPT